VGFRSPPLGEVAVGKGVAQTQHKPEEGKTMSANLKLVKSEKTLKYREPKLMLEFVTAKVNVRKGEGRQVLAAKIAEAVEMELRLTKQRIAEGDVTIRCYRVK
jgi:hypothetical protein